MYTWSKQVTGSAVVPDAACSAVSARAIRAVLADRSARPARASLATAEPGIVTNWAEAGRPGLVLPRTVPALALASEPSGWAVMTRPAAASRVSSLYPRAARRPATDPGGVRF